MVEYCRISGVEGSVIQLQVASVQGPVASRQVPYYFGARNTIRGHGSTPIQVQSVETEIALSANSATSRKKIFGFIRVNPCKSADKFESSLRPRRSQRRAFLTLGNWQLATTN